MLVKPGRQPWGWRCLWGKSEWEGGSHKRGWERLRAAPQASCLKDTGGPGGGAVGEEHRALRATGLSHMHTNTRAGAHTQAHICLQSPSKRHYAASPNVLSQSPTAAGSAGAQGPQKAGPVPAARSTVPEMGFLSWRLSTGTVGMGPAQATCVIS